MSSHNEERDVQAQLVRDRRRRREPGESPYPVQYSRDIADFDNWVTIFFRRVCQGHSVHHFEAPPRKVLDLGCGSGAWVMDAAAAWPDTNFVGLDMRDIQPDLEWLKNIIESEQVARRVKWVHANFLDKWPLSSATFDYVHICKIGLGVPEDEWPDILEEVNRVLKPGGILDIIEEDLIFPAGPTPSPSPPVDSESQSLRTSGGSTSSTTSNYPSSSSNRSRPSHSGMPPAPSGVASTSRAQSTPRRTSHAVGSQASAHTPLPLTMDSTSPPDFRPDPRDHSRLRESWEALISRRFLASKLTSILHLHLTGTFARVHVHPLIQIPLPPNSAQAKPGEGRSVDAELTDDEGFGEEQSAADSRAFLSVSSSQRAAAQQTPGFYEGLTLADLSWIEGSGPMHLACVVKTIEGCQEALWQEYQELFAREPRCGDNTPREDFEMYWDNWLNDMHDRMGIRRQAICAGWTEPPDDPDHGPDWRKWRNGLSDLDVSMPNTPAAADGRKNSFTSSASASAPASAPSPVPLCRSTRGFSCVKALADK